MAVAKKVLAARCKRAEREGRSTGRKKSAESEEKSAGSEEKSTGSEERSTGSEEKTAGSEEKGKSVGIEVEKVPETKDEPQWRQRMSSVSDRRIVPVLRRKTPEGKE